jgi:hypothetical protein
LDAVAMGKRPLIADDGRYSGYLDQTMFLPLSYKKVGGSIFEPLPEMVFPGMRHNLRHFTFASIDTEHLTHSLRAAYRDRGSLVQDETKRREFLQKFDWNTVAESLVSYL